MNSQLEIENSGGGGGDSSYGGGHSYCMEDSGGCD